MSKIINPQCTIDMTVLNDSEFLSPYSATDTPVVSSDVAEFLEHGAEKFLPKQSIVLNIHSDCIDDEEKVIYDNAIRNYFGLKLSAQKNALKRNLLVSVIFTVIGILGLALMFVLDRLGVGGIWVEVVDIFAWVFLWEAVDQFFIERRSVIRNQKKYQAFTQLQINYVPFVK